MSAQLDEAQQEIDRLSAKLADVTQLHRGAIETAKKFREEMRCAKENQATARGMAKEDMRHALARISELEEKGASGAGGDVGFFGPKPVPVEPSETLRAKLKRMRKQRNRARKERDALIDQVLYAAGWRKR